jgi:inositol phosphorylceramide synthase catalytic subunit
MGMTHKQAHRFMKKSFLNLDNKNTHNYPLFTAQSLIQGSAARFFSLSEIVLLVVMTTCYFSWFYNLVGLRTEHVFQYVLLLSLYFISPKTRQFFWAFSIFTAYWFSYDSLRILPNYKVNPVHISDLYDFEKSIFGINTEGGILTPNEYFRANHTPFGDVFTAFFYVNWMPIPLIFGIYLFFKNKPLLLNFSATFFFVNLLGFIVYYTYPAAPPWYMEQFGNTFHQNTPSNAAGLLNFDKLFGITFFQNLYQKNSNVFAAMPSMHSAFPVVCFLCGLQVKKRWLNILFGIFALGIWFSAIYTRHHYITDVVVGACLAVLGFYWFQYLREKTRLKTFFDYLLTKF